MRSKIVVLTFGLVTGLAACSDGSSPASDAGPDASTDADADTDTDADTDADTDTDTDTDADTDTDTATGTGTDTGTGPAEDLVCNGVEPDAMSTLEDGTFSMIGTGFQSGMTVEVVETTSSDSVALGEVDWGGPHASTLDVAAGDVAAGTYEVILTNPDSETATCPDTIDWLDVPPPTVTSVTPPSAWEGSETDEVLSDQQVVITGTNFLETPAVIWVDVNDSEARYPAALTLFTDAENLGSICPSESDQMPAGFYHVEVVNPNGLGAFWREGGELAEFEVTATPPPDIHDVDPFRSPAASDITLDVSGSYFQDGATTYAILPDYSELELTTTYVGAATLSVDLPSGTLAQGVYPLKVVNPDSQYDIWYAYEATPSSAGHLEPFSPSGQEMVTPRWRQGSCEGFDDFLGAYIYSAGGLDADGNVLDTVEVLPVSIFGDAGTPWISRQWVDAETPRADNMLVVPRNGLALVRAGDWLYAVGGTSVDTSVASPEADALDSVERARILGLDTRPKIDSSSWTDGGTLETGTWYYKVSAVGPWGESLASSAEMLYGASGTITIEWSAVDGAESYNIYRNADASGNGGAVALLDSGETGTVFVDDGSAAIAEGAPVPLPFGSLGNWAVLDETMQNAREGVDSVVITIPSGEEDVDDKTYLYAVGGRPDATGTGYFASGEKAEVLEDGELAAFEMLSHSMNTPRSFYALLTNQGQDTSGFVPEDPDIPLEKSVGEGEIYLMAIMGDDQHDGNGNDGLNDMEVCKLLSPDGDNEAWATQTDEMPGGRNTHGHDALLYFNFMFVFAAVNTETPGSYPIVQTSAASRFEFHEDAAEMIDVLQSFQSTSTTISTPRAYYELVRVNGYDWALGGADGSGPVTSIDRVLQ